MFRAAVAALLLAASPAAARPPNLVVLLADDVGYGDLGCFGQKTLETPRLDRMAKEGMRLTQFYAGGAAGAASRCVLLTGKHGGRAALRGPVTKLPADEPTVAGLLKRAGYATACVGGWGLGDDPAAPRAAGFDRFFGALTFPHANTPFPEALVRDGAAVKLRNEYAPALQLDEALGFIREQRARPFFLYLPLTVPHANAAAGDKAWDAPNVADFAGRDWPAAEKGFAAQLRTLDTHVGRVLDLLAELKLDRDTLVLFTSDNGPANEAGHKADFFKSAGTMRGVKGELFEGSIRVPTLAWWPGTVAAGAANDLQWYAGDLTATAAELAGVMPPAGLDSDSLLPALRGAEEKDRWKRRSPLYWETPAGPTAQAVRFGKWKALRSPLGTGPVELYDMSNDTGERRDYSQRRPDLTRHATALLERHHRPLPP